MSTTTRYVSILHRLLGMRLVYESTQTLGRNISFEYMNRQLVWHGFTVQTVCTLTYSTGIFDVHPSVG